MSNPLITAEEKQMKKGMEAANAFIRSVAKDMADENVTRMSELAFKEMFLPYFKGEVPDESKDVMREKWIHIAGSPQKEVVLLDNDGNETKRVPPLIGTYKTSEQSQKLPLYETGMRMIRNIESGQGFRNVNMQDSMLEAIEDTVKPDASHKDTWGAFLDSFNRKAVVKNVVVKEEEGFDF